jgi:hypothetical protein
VVAFVIPTHFHSGAGNVLSLSECGTLRSPLERRGLRSRQLRHGMVATLNASAIAMFGFDPLACVSGHRTVSSTVTAIVPTRGRALHRNGVSNDSTPSAPKNFMYSSTRLLCSKTNRYCSGCQCGQSISYLSTLALSALLRTSYPTLDYKEVSLKVGDLRCM